MTAVEGTPRRLSGGGGRGGGGGGWGEKRARGAAQKAISNMNKTCSARHIAALVAGLEQQAWAASGYRSSGCDT